MKQIIDTPTVVISVNLNLMNSVDRPSQVQLPMNLRFAADELVLKSIVYGGSQVDVDDIIQIWFNITNDNIIGSFTNAIPHFKISNTFQTGNFMLQFQQTDITSYNPQALISSQVPQRTFNKVVLTFEFLRHSK